MTNEYKNALSEVNAILNLLSEDMKNKIPQSFFEFVNKNKSETYRPNFDMDLPLTEQKLLKDTKVILSLMYRSYLCDENTRRKLEIDDMIEIRTKQMELEQKYSYENLFKKSK